MPTIGWIDALRTYNAGMPSWCVPRKGTPGYDRVMRIRTGEEKAKTFKELTEELERKTGGKPKAEKKSMSISLDKDTQSVKVPTISDEAPKTDRPSTKKLSVSNNKEAMAVVPVNTVAEGGSPKKSKEVAEAHAYGDNLEYWSPNGDRWEVGREAEANAERGTASRWSGGMGGKWIHKPVIFKDDGSVMMQFKKGGPFNTRLSRKAPKEA
jgi:hypothetical protein